MPTPGRATPGPTSDEIRALAAEATRSADTSQVLADRLADATRRDMRLEQQSRVTIAGIVLLGILFAWVGLTLLSGRSASRSAVFTIEDCINPEGKCYARSHAEQAGAITQIQQGIAQDMARISACRYTPDEAGYWACVSHAIPDLFPPAAAQAPPPVTPAPPPAPAPAS